MMIADAGGLLDFQIWGMEPFPKMMAGDGGLDDGSDGRVNVLMTRRSLSGGSDLTETTRQRATRRSLSRGSELTETALVHKS